MYSSISCKLRYNQIRYVDVPVIAVNPKWSRWRHQMETFFALLAICAGNSPVTGEFPTQRPVTRSKYRQTLLHAGFCELRSFVTTYNIQTTALSWKLAEYAAEHPRIQPPPPKKKKKKKKIYLATILCNLVDSVKLRKLSQQWAK